MSHRCLHPSGKSATLPPLSAPLPYCVIYTHTHARTHTLKVKGCVPSVDTHACGIGTLPPSHTFWCRLNLILDFVINQLLNFCKSSRWIVFCLFFYMKFLFPCQRVDRQHLLCSKGQTINHCRALHVLWCDWDLWNLTFKSSYVWVKVWLRTLIETNEPAKLMLFLNICCIQFYQTFSFIFGCESWYSADIGPPNLTKEFRSDPSLPEMEQIWLYKQPISCTNYSPSATIVITAVTNTYINTKSTA